MKYAKKGTISRVIHGKLLFILLIAIFLEQCSDHTFNNPLDPDNIGNPDEYLLLFQSPAEEPGDLGWDGIFLWNSDLMQGKLLQLNPYDGTLSEIISSPMKHPFGVTYAKDSLWISDQLSRRIMEIDALTGRELFSFPSPGTNPRGLAFDEENNILYNVDSNSLKIYALNPDTGNTISSFASRSSNPYGLTCSSDYLFVAGFSENVIFIIDKDDGSLVLELPGPDLAPVGLTWDKVSLWVLDWNSMVYRITLSSL